MQRSDLLMVSVSKKSIVAPWCIEHHSKGKVMLLLNVHYELLSNCNAIDFLVAKPPFLISFSFLAGKQAGQLPCGGRKYAERERRITQVQQRRIHIQANTNKQQKHSLLYLETLNSAKLCV